MKILILGANGFIGHHLSKKLLDKNFELYAMDLSSDKLPDCLNNSNFHFIEGDISINKEWIEYHIKKCDIVLPLVAIATPSIYIKDPLRVFELDFEENLKIIRQCVKYKKRVIFPSTSEVYGMSTDQEFNPNETNLVVGPINKQRWIYSVSKQLLDRIIYAYGVKDNFDYTIFRPFNWFGSGLDNIFDSKEGASRVITQFLGNICRGKNLLVVDGGKQRRAFTHIDDGIDALVNIIENHKLAFQKIFNIGNPKNDFSINELANKMLERAKKFKGYDAHINKIKIEYTNSDNYYGTGYQDVMSRVPYIKNLEKLGWSAKVSLDEGLDELFNFYSTQIDNAGTLISD